MFRFLIDRSIPDFLAQGLRSRGYEVDCFSMDVLLADKDDSLRSRLVDDDSIFVGIWNQEVFDRLLALYPAQLCEVFVSDPDVRRASDRLDRLLVHKPYLFQKGCTVFLSNLRLLVDGTVSPEVARLLADDGFEIARSDEHALRTSNRQREVVLSADVTLPERAGHLEGPRPPMIVISPELAGKDQHIADRVSEILDCRPFVLEENAVVLLAAGMDRIRSGRGSP